MIRTNAFSAVVVSACRWKLSQGPPEGLFGVGVFGTQNADVTPEDPMGRHSQLAKGELYGLPARWGRVVFGKLRMGNLVTNHLVWGGVSLRLEMLQGDV